MTVHGASDELHALPPGLLEALLSDATPQVTAEELKRVRRRLAVISVEEPEVLAVIARRFLEASTV